MAGVRMPGNTLVFVFFFILASCVLLPGFLVSAQYPGRDSGGALYAGWRILNGDLLYRQVWDHKPPLIYFINALGLLIGRGGIGGIFFMECVSLLCAILFSYFVLSKAWGRIPAFFATAAWVINLPLVIEGGNLPEEYALPLQFAAFALCLRSQNPPGWPWGWFLFGFLGGAVFSIRPNLTGIWVSSVLCLFISRDIRKILRILLAMGCGAAVVPGALALYFGGHGALRDLWDAVIRYNMAYSSAPMAKRFAAVGRGFRILSASGLAPIAAVAWALGLARLISGEGGSGRRILMLAVVALPVELFFASFPGTIYPHYFVSLLPVTAVLLGFLTCELQTGLMNLGGIDGRTVRCIFLFCLCALLTVMSIIPARSALRQAKTGRETAARHSGREAAAYLRSKTGGGDNVLVWGAEPAVYFISKRKCPTRFSFQYPLFTRGYTNEAIVEKFLHEIETARPRVIIDSSPNNRVIPPLDGGGRGEMRESRYCCIERIREIYDFVSRHYVLATRVGRQRWPVYVLKGAAI